MNKQIDSSILFDPGFGSFKNIKLPETGIK